MLKAFLPLVALGLAYLTAAIPASAIDPANDAPRLFAFEVSEDASVKGKFVFDDAPLHQDGLPAYGASFITGGYVYPVGTLEEGRGVLPSGEPEFENLVMGSWICRGHFIGDGAHTTTGPIVATTQTYDLGRKPGEKMFVTEGVEIADFGEEVERAITGGTGPYRNSRGVILQELLGFNQTGGVNLRVTVHMIGE